MAGVKEIRNKIKSVQNTRKITKAMEMVAASKMRKAQERMRQGRPYADKVRNIAAHMSRANPEYRHPFMLTRETLRKAAYIVVTTDKGLCGALNTNLLRALVSRLREQEKAGVTVSATAIGNKGFGFLSRLGTQIDSHVIHLGDRPHLETLIGAIKVQLDAFAAGQTDAVFLCYTRFVNTMRQEPVIEQLLPLTAERLEQTVEERGRYGWDYIYEPDAQSVVDDLLVRYVEALIYQAVAENIASEQSARMVAMKAASDNAKKVIDELKLAYNKTRQAAITKEIAEIVGGAAAIG